jgi:hypothetical protein
MFVIFMVLDGAHAITRIPLHQHRQLVSRGIFVENLAARTRAEFLLLGFAAVDIDNQLGLSGLFHDIPRKMSYPARRRRSRWVGRRARYGRR